MEVRSMFGNTRVNEEDGKYSLTIKSLSYTHCGRVAHVKWMGEMTDI
jgi:hypothetical protein